jgi:HD-GYP domain-containing protein (c-di-GMP phosphodiesterase class II)
MDNTISKGNLIFSLLECIDLVHPSILEDVVKAGYLVWKTTEKLNLSDEVQSEAVSATLLSIIGSIKERSPNFLSINELFTDSVSNTNNILNMYTDFSHYHTWFDYNGKKEVTIKDIIPSCIKLVDYLKTVDYSTPISLDALQLPQKLESHFYDILNDDHVKSEFRDPFLEQILFNGVQWSHQTFSLQSLEKLSLFLLKLLHIKKPHIAIHSYITGEIAHLLSQSQNLSTKQATLIKIAGYVQHLGKIGFPNHLLEKGAPLSKHEKALLHNSPYFTFKILKHLDCYKEVIIWSSFDYRLNENKKKKRIPLEIEILQLSDVYVTLRDLNQRTKSPIDEVIRQLQEKSENELNENLIYSLKRQLGKVEYLRQSSKEKAENILFAKNKTTA